MQRLFIRTTQANLTPYPLDLNYSPKLTFDDFNLQDSFNSLMQQKNEAELVITHDKTIIQK